ASISSLFRSHSPIPYKQRITMTISDTTQDERLTIPQALQRALEHHQARRLQEAAHLYRLVLEARPYLAEVHSNLGAVLQTQGQLEAAIACYREALRLQPELPRLKSNLGTALYAIGRFDEAIVSFEDALRASGADAETLCNLGAALEATGNIGGAIARYRAA